MAVDSAPALHNFHNHLGPVSSTWETPFVSPFWDRAVAAGYDRIRVIPVQMPGTDWRPLGYFAVTHHMQIDSVYLGRVDDNALEALRARDSMVLETGDLEPRTIYIIDAESAAIAAQHLRPGDLLATIDDHIVLVRDGVRLIDGLGIAPRLEPAKDTG